MAMILSYFIIETIQAAMLFRALKHMVLKCGYWLFAKLLTVRKRRKNAILITLLFCAN